MPPANHLKNKTMKKNKHNEAELMKQATREINRHFGIRVSNGRDSKLCSLGLLAAILADTPRALHLAQKALDSRDTNPTFRAKGLTIVFFWR